jgi:hypothetical protein
MPEILSKFSFPTEWGFVREPARPKDLQVLDFDKTYDYHTLWNDAIQIRPDTLLLIGPPLYNAVHWINNSCHFYDELGNKLDWKYSELDRACVTVVSTKTWMQKLIFVTPYNKHEITINYSSSDFNNKTVIITISKNNPISWLKQWIDFHHVVHGVDGILLYNNQSTIYTNDYLESQLYRPDMTIKVVDYNVPYGTLGGGLWSWQGRNGTYLPWDSDFAQYVMLEHAKWRYLHSSKLVISADSDELLTIPNTTLSKISEYCETSTNSVWQYKGIWIEPVDGDTKEIASSIANEDRCFNRYWLTNYSEQRGIGIKWLMNPRRNLEFQWRMHDVTGPHMMTQDISYGHYLAMNTGWSWKRDSYNSDISSLTEYMPIKRDLDIWNKFGALK